MNANHIKNLLIDNATQGDDVMINADPGSITLESFSFSHGHVDDLELDTDNIEVIEFDHMAPSEVVMINKEIFDQALEALGDLSPDVDLVNRVENITRELNQVRALVGLGALIKLEGSNNG